MFVNALQLHVLRIFAVLGCLPFCFFLAHAEELNHFLGRALRNEEFRDADLSTLVLTAVILGNCIKINFIVVSVVVVFRWIILLLNGLLGFCERRINNSQRKVHQEECADDHAEQDGVSPGNFCCYECTDQGAHCVRQKREEEIDRCKQMDVLANFLDRFGIPSRRWDHDGAQHDQSHVDKTTNEQTDHHG